MLETRVVVQSITINEYNVVMISRVRLVLEDGIVIAENHLGRSSIAPGEDYSQEVERVQSICQTLHTPEAIAIYTALISPSAP